MDNTMKGLSGSSRLKLAFFALFAVTMILTITLSPAPGLTQSRTQNELTERIDKLAGQIEEKVIAWRRDIHEHPELSNREYKTAEKVAAHLRGLGIEVKTGVSTTGVVGLLKGGKPEAGGYLRPACDRGL